MVDAAAIRMIVADEDRARAAPLAAALRPSGRHPGGTETIGDAVVLVASQSAAGSGDVDRQLVAWTGEHPTVAVLLVLFDGELSWDNDLNAFDSTATTALSRTAQECFATRPLWLDARGGISDHLVGRVLAALHPRDSPVEIAPAELPGPLAAAGRRERGRRRIWWLVPVVAIVLIVVVGALLTVGGLGEVESPGPPMTTVGDEPGEPSDGSTDPSGWWLLLAAGIIAGLVAGIWLGSHRRASERRQPGTLVAGPRAMSASGRGGAVFISHDFDTDHALARRLADDLRAHSDVWIAPESIAPGESWLMAVEHGLSMTRVFVALLSKASLASPWVLKEVQAAMDLEVQNRLRLVPVQVDDCDIPILLRTYQTLRLASGYAEVVEQTRRLLALAPNQPTITSTGWGFGK